MAETPTSCPGGEVLEGLALGQGETSALLAHVAACAACRERVEKLRADNQFLMGFVGERGFSAGASRTAHIAQPGEIDIPGYELVREIQHGGQGVVWLAVQLATKRRVAIKLMKQGPFATLADRARFDREIETLGRLNHPNIVTVHDAGTVAGYQYFVMDYFDGHALDEALPGLGARIAERAHSENADRQRVEAAVALFIKVCDAVHAAHLRGIIHRDLKPSNIRVDADGEPHVLDFGLAKSTLSERDETITRTGQFVGSLPWAAPEQVEGGSAKIDLRTDVYSLGTMLFQLLTGALPFDVDTNLRDAVENILYREAPRPAVVAAENDGPRIDDELDTIVCKCLSKDRERRYQTAGEVARDLRRYLAGEAIEAKRDSAIYVLRKTLHRYRLRVAAATAFVVLLGVFGVVMALLYRESVQLEHEATASANSLTDLLAQSNVEQGRMAVVLGNMEQAEQLLWNELLTHRQTGGGAPLRLNAPPGPPEAYWSLWQLYRRFPCLLTVPRDASLLHTATLAADGASIWTIDDRGKVQLIDARGHVRDAFNVRPPGGLGMLFVGARGQCVIRSGPEEVFVWKRAAGEHEVLRLPVQRNPLGGASQLSASGKFVVGFLDDGIAVWGVDAPEPVAHFAVPQVAFASCAISYDDQYLAARDELGVVYLWDIPSGRLVAKMRGAVPPPENLHGHGEMLFSRDGKLLADAWAEIPGRVWDLTTSPPRAVMLSEMTGDRRTIALSPDGALLAVGDLIGAVYVFDAHSGAKLSQFVAHPGRVRNVAFTRDGRRLWSCADDGLRLWEVQADGAVDVLRFEGDGLHTVDLSPDGAVLSAGGGLGVVYRVDPTTLARTRWEFGNDRTVSCIATSPDGSRVAAGTYGNALYVWDSADGAAKPRRIAHPNRLSSICFSPDGALLATACDDNHVRVWRSDDGTLVHTFATAARVPQVTFDATGEHLAAVVRDGSLHVWDVRDGSEAVWVKPTTIPLRAVRYFPDGARLLIAGADRVITILDTTSHREIGRLAGHNQEIYAVTVSADGTMIASGDTGGTIRLWDAANERLLTTLDGHEGAVMSLRFSRDGHRLMSAGLDCTLRIWDLLYYRQHLAGNLEAQLQRVGADAIDWETTNAWRTWAEGGGH